MCVRNSLSAWSIAHPLEMLLKQKGCPNMAPRSFTEGTALCPDAGAAGAAVRAKMERLIWVPRLFPLLRSLLPVLRCALHDVNKVALCDTAVQSGKVCDGNEGVAVPKGPAALWNCLPSSTYSLAGPPRKNHTCCHSTHYSAIMHCFAYLAAGPSLLTGVQLKLKLDCCSVKPTEQNLCDWHHRKHIF